MMNKTVAIVEDNIDIAYILEYFLAEEGYLVSVYNNAATFISHYNSKLPDIFLIDVMLPDGDGISLCNMVKSNPLSEQLPVLIMSAHSPAEKISSESRADGFIKKPFDLNEIKVRLDELVN